MQDTAYHLVLPHARRTSVILSSPHSGRLYEPAFLARSVLDKTAIRSSEDAFIDLLIAGAPLMGAPMIAAVAPRAYVDLNRASDELDPALIDGVDRNSHNPRVSSGLGVIPRVVANGRAIYAGKLTRAEAEERLDRYWRPYHRNLQALIDENRLRYGEAILIDMHSMPREAIDGYGRSSGPRPEVVLGDRFGAAASPVIVARIEAAFAAAGLRVARNAPFAGAFITQHYGRPARGQHAVQVEIDRGLYMDEATIRPGPGFSAFRHLLNGVLAEIIAIGAPPVALAAE